MELKIDLNFEKGICCMVTRRIFDGFRLIWNFQGQNSVKRNAGSRQKVKSNYNIAYRSM